VLVAGGKLAGILGETKAGGDGLEVDLGVGVNLATPSLEDAAAIPPASLRGLGLDRYPDLRTMLFGNYEAILYLRQAPSELLAAKAAAIAAYLELPLEVLDVRMGALEDRLATLVEA